jgi:hypothetical protein
MLRSKIPLVVFDLRDGTVDMVLLMPGVVK